MYTGVSSLNSAIAMDRPSEFSLKLVKYEGNCIYANINDRAHDGFQIWIDGVPVQDFLSEIATENECYTFFEK